MHDISDSCCSFWIIYAFSFNPLRFMLWYTLMLLYSLSVGPSLWQSIWCHHTWVFHPLIQGTTWNISFYPFFYSPSRASNFWIWQFHLYLPCLFLFLLSFFLFFCNRDFPNLIFQPSNLFYLKVHPTFPPSIVFCNFPILFLILHMYFYTSYHHLVLF